MKVSDLKKSTNFKLLQFSEAGAGKTFRAVSALRFGKVLIIDTDNKFTGMVGRLSQAYGEAEISAKVEIEQPKSAAEFRSVMDNISKLSADFATVVVDTQSRAFDMVLDDIKAANPKGDGRQIFGICMERNVAYLNRLLSLPQNVIINAHIGSEEMADGTQKLTSTTPGKFGKKLPEFFNEVHHLYLDGNNKHKVRGEPSGMVVARTVCDKTLLDSLGMFKVADLSIFDSIAFRK